MTMAAARIQIWRNVREFCTKYSQMICGAAVSAVFTGMYVPQGLFCHQLAYFHQMYENGLPKELEQNTQDLCQEVLDEILLPVEREVDVKFIACFNADPIKKGSTKTRGGTLIGLPANFKYSSLDDTIADRSRLLAGGKALDWAKESTQKFAASLVWSDNAKRFVIAREIKRADSFELLFRPLSLSFSMFLAYTGGHFFNQVYKLRQRLPLRYRVPMYALWASGGTLLYVLIKDTYSFMKENSSDKRAASLNRSYALGGVEYLEKILERNIALRELVPDGEKYYTIYGNQVSTWRQKQVPILERLDKLKAHLAEYDKKEKEDELQANAKTDEDCVHCKS